MEGSEAERLTETSCLEYWLWRILAARNEKLRPLLLWVPLQCCFM